MNRTTPDVRITIERNKPTRIHSTPSGQTAASVPRCNNPIDGISAGPKNPMTNNANAEKTNVTMSAVTAASAATGRQNPTIISNCDHTNGTISNASGNPDLS